MKRNLSLLMALFCFALALAGCGGTSSSTAAASASSAVSVSASSKEDSASGKAGGVIGVTLLTREHVFYNIVENAMLERAKEWNVELIVADGQQDSNLQYSQMQDFVTQGVDGVIIAAASSGGTKAAIDMVQEQGIPVVTIGTKTDGNPDAHFQTDEIKGGNLAGEYAAKALDGKGEVAIITYDEIEGCVNRAEGFKEILADYPDITVVDEQNYQGEAEKAASISQDFITKHPDLALIFCVGDPAATGAYTTYNAANKDVMIIGYDGNPEAIAEIVKGGIWIADVAQDPVTIGESAVQAIVDINAGKTVEKETNVAPFIVDAKNAEV